jgi:trk system potassium uptake protein TrkH
MIFVFSWLALVAIESDGPWSTGAHSLENKLIDSAGAVAATLNNIGPGLGVVGPTENYSSFSSPSKLIFTVLMMLGRLELFSIMVLVLPGFWRER